jgi:hypothetical protein
MKNIILASVLAVTAVTTLDANAASTAFCNAANVAGDATAAAAAGGTSSFIKVAFTPKCSANVFLNGNDESALLFRIGSASNKGKSYFGGSSSGGAVARQGDCGGTCDATKASAGMNAASSS